MFKKNYAYFGPKKKTMDILHIHVQNPKAHTGINHHSDQANSQNLEKNNKISI